MVSLKPSDRFLEVLKPYFVSKGYAFIKSKKMFTRPFLNGNYVMIVGFLKSGSLVEAEMHFGIDYPALETLFANVHGLKRHPYKGCTVGSDLNMLPEIRFNREPYYFPLYGSETYEVTDTSIGKAALEFVAAFETHVETFLTEYSDLTILEKKLNVLPISNSGLTWVIKQTVFGLSLASLFAPEKYDLIHESYKKYIVTHVDFEELSKTLSLTNQFIKENKLSAQFPK